MKKKTITLTVNNVIIAVVLIIAIFFVLTLMRGGSSNTSSPQTYYCGDSICNNGESCSSCSSDCGSCPAPSLYCGDGTCNNGETCSSCSSDCGECKSALGESCFENSACQSGFCVNQVCRQSSTFCGDYYCDSGETRQTCPTDCLREVQLPGVSSSAICESYTGWAVAENYNGRIAEYNPENGMMLFQYITSSPDSTIDCLRNNNFLVVIWNSATMRYEIQEINHYGQVVQNFSLNDVGCNPNSADNKVLTYGTRWLISCYDTSNSYKIIEFDPISKIKYSVNSANNLRDIFIKGSYYGYIDATTIYLYKGEGYGFQTQAYIPRAALQAITVLKNGNYLVADVMYIYEYDGNTGKELKTKFMGTDSLIYDVAELSNGNWLVMSIGKAIEVNPATASNW